jgi:hypothetical protein
MQTLNIFGNHQNNNETGANKMETHKRKFGMDENEYYAMCREYDRRWDAVKHMYQIKLLTEGKPADA